VVDGVLANVDVFQDKSINDGDVVNLNSNAEQHDVRTRGTLIRKPRVRITPQISVREDGHDRRGQSEVHYVR
jgi:hypothetical protein